MFQQFLLKQYEAAEQIQSTSSPEVFKEQEYVPMPSEGLFYPGDKKEILCRKLNFTDEDILTNPSYYNNNTIYSVIVNRVIQDPEFTYESLIPIDRDAILIWLRMAAWGNEYRVVANCPKCGQGGSILWDLKNITVQGVANPEDEKMLEEYGFIPYQYDSNSVIGITNPNLGHIKAVDDFCDALEKKSGVKQIATRNLLYFVSHVELKAEEKMIENVEDIYLWFVQKNLSPTVSKELREIGMRVNIGISVKSNFICKKQLKNEEGQELWTSDQKPILCDYKEEGIELPMSINFFRATIPS